MSGRAPLPDPGAPTGLVDELISCSKRRCGMKRKPLPDALRGGMTAPTVEPSPPAPAPQALNWDGWREVDYGEWSRSTWAGRVVEEWDRPGKLREPRRYFLPVAPIPDDAIGMCRNGHVMVRVNPEWKGDDGWRHMPVVERCSDNPIRTVEVIGTRNRP